MPYVQGDLHYTVDRRCIDLMLPLDFLSTLELACPLIRERFERAVAQGKGFKLFEQAMIPFKVRNASKNHWQHNARQPVALLFRVKVREIILLVLLHYYEMNSGQHCQPPKWRGGAKASVIKQWFSNTCMSPSILICSANSSIQTRRR
jgi:hypothetical protein